MMTRSGTLLIGWTDPSGQLARLRNHLGVTFQGASSKQSNIIHTSLLRVVALPQQQKQQQQQQGQGQQQQQQQQQEDLGQFPAPVLASLSDMCELLTQRYRGMRMHVGQVHWVVEEQFSTVQGPKVPVQLEVY
jgi:hypothetical protein